MTSVPTRGPRAGLAVLVAGVTAFSGLAALAPAAHADPDTTKCGVVSFDSLGLGGSSRPVAADGTSVLRVFVAQGRGGGSDRIEHFRYLSNGITPHLLQNPNGGDMSKGAELPGSSSLAVGRAVEFDFDATNYDNSKTIATLSLSASFDSDTPADACTAQTFYFSKPVPGANASFLQASVHQISADGTSTAGLVVRSYGGGSATSPTPAVGDAIDVTAVSTLTLLDNGNEKPRDSHQNAPFIRSTEPDGALTTDRNGVVTFAVSQRRMDGHANSEPQDDEDIEKFYAYDRTTNEVIGPPHQANEDGNDFENEVNGADVISFGAPPSNEAARIDYVIGNEGYPDSPPNGGSNDVMVPTGTAPADGTSTVTVGIIPHADGIDDSDPILTTADVRLVSGMSSAVVTPLGHADYKNPGEFYFTVTDRNPETVTLTAFDNSHNVTATNTAKAVFSPVQANAELSTFDVSPSADASGTVTAAGDGLSQVMITEHVRDAAGNPAVGQSVALYSTAGTAVISPSSGTTDNGGNVTFNVTSTTAPQQVNLQAQDSTNGSLVLHAPTINFVPGATSSTKSTTNLDGVNSTTSAPATGTGQSSQAFIHVHLLDAGGNVIAGRAVSLDQHTGHSVISGNGAFTNANGDVYFPIADGRAETVTYDVNIPEDSITLQSRPKVTFTAGAPSAATTTVTATPAAGDAGGPNVTVSVVLRDANGIAIPGTAVGLASSATGTQPGAPLCPAASTAGFVPAGAASGTAPTPCASLTTDANGGAGFTFSDSAAAGESRDVRAYLFNSSGNPVGDALGSPATVTFAGPVVPGNSSTSASATSAPATGQAVTVRVLLLDANKFPVVGKTVTLNTGNATPTVAPATTGSDTTDGTGTAVFTVRDRASQTAKIQAIDATDNSIPVGNPVTITFTGPPSQSTSTLSVSSNSVNSDGKSPVTVTAVVRDAVGHPIPGESVTLSAASGAATFTATTDGTGAKTLTQPATTGVTLTTDGAGTVSATATDATPETVTFNGNDVTGFTAFGQAPAVVFVAPNGEAADSTVTAANSPIPAGSSTNVTVTLTDASGVIPGHQVELTLGSANGPVIDTVTTSTSGVAVFPVTYNRPSTQRYYATDLTASPAVVLTAVASVVYTGAPSEAAYSTVTASPTQAVVGSTSNITVTLVNGVGTPVINEPVSLSADHGDLATSPDTGTTDSTGTVVFTESDNTVETDTYTATDTGMSPAIVVEQTASVAWTAATPEAASSTVAVSATQVPADGASFSRVTVGLVGTNGPLVNDIVELHLTGTGGKPVVSQITNPTDQQGRAVFSVTDTKVENVVFQVYDRTTGVTLAKTAQLSFTAPASQPTVSSVVPLSGPAVGGTRLSITGGGLSQITSVIVGSAAATGLTHTGDGTINAFTPAGTGVQPITLVAGPGTSYPVGNFSYPAATTTPITPAPTPAPIAPAPVASTPAPIVTAPVVTVVTAAPALKRAVTVRNAAAESLAAAALDASRSAHRKQTVGVVVLANGKSTNDVAVAEALAHKMHGDLLLTVSSGLDRATSAELARVAGRRSTVILVASTGEITAKAASGLAKAQRTVKRFAGTGPTGTSVATLVGAKGRGVVLADASETLTVAEAAAYASRRGDLLLLTNRGGLTSDAKAALKHVSITAVFGRASAAHQRTAKSVGANSAADALLAQSSAPTSLVVTDGNAGSVLRALLAAPTTATGILVGPAISSTAQTTLRGDGRVAGITAVNAPAPTVATVLLALAAVGVA